jgi:hypothetical protein
MRNIQPITIWKDGENKQADSLELFAANDNLINSVVFYYALYSEGQNLISGNLILSGTEYDLWQDNEYAWNWVATKLGLVLIPSV